MRSALKNSNCEFPRTKVTINLAPADVKKEGSAYDLPIALALLQASRQLESDIDWSKTLFLGELSLDGKLRAVPGVLVAARAARRLGFRQLFVPPANAAEAALVPEVEVYAPASLAEVLAHLTGRSPLASVPATVLPELLAT